MKVRITLNPDPETEITVSANPVDIFAWKELFVSVLHAASFHPELVSELFGDDVEYDKYP